MREKIMPDCGLTDAEIAAVNKDMAEREAKAVARIKSAPASRYKGLFVNDEEKCPSTIGDFDVEGWGETTADRYFAERAELWRLTSIGRPGKITMRGGFFSNLAAKISFIAL